MKLFIQCLVNLEMMFKKNHSIHIELPRPLRAVIRAAGTAGCRAFSTRLTMLGSCIGHNDRDKKYLVGSM